MRHPHHRGKLLPKLWYCGFLTLTLGCAAAERPEQVSSSTGLAADFSAFEDRLLNAGTVKLDFHVSAEGAFEADLRGALDIGPKDQILLTATGHFGGKPVDLLLRSEDQKIELGNGTNRTKTASPAHLQEALLIGFTRMGILHNLARLTGAMAPDHADGGVREWVTVGSFAAEAADPDALSFEITVAGQPAGSASLEVDSHGRPIVRRQTVQFPSGEMRVVERYSAVTIDPYP